MTSNTASFLRVALLLLAISLLAGLSAFAYLGTFSRYGADDYCFSRRLIQTGNLFDASLVWYLNTSNRYTTMPLVGISEWFGPSAIRYLPMLAIFLWVVTLMWTLAQFSKKMKFPHPWLAGFALAGLISFFAILEAPNRYQSIYWRSGMVTYFAPLIAFSFLAGLILNETWRKTPRSKFAWVVVLTVTWLGFFLTGGLSETALAIQGGVLGLAILFVWFAPPGDGKRRAWILLSTALSASILSLTVIFLSPANALRVRAFGPPPPVLEVLQFSLIYAWDFMRETFKSLPTPTLISVVTAALLGFGLASEEMSPSQRRTLGFALMAVPFITYLLIFFSMTPSMYGQGTYPGARALMAARAVMVTGLMAFGLLAGVLFREMPAYRLADSKVRAFTVMVGLLFLSLSPAYPLYATDQVLDLFPHYRARAEQWDLRDEQIRQAVAEGKSRLVVVQLDSIGGVIEYKRNRNHWVNKCVAEYYGLRFIRAR